MKFRNVLSPGLVIAVGALSTGAFGQTISVVVNGQPIPFDTQQPIMQDDRVLVPLRGVFEHLGAQVNWDPSTQTVTGIRGHTKVQLTIGQTTTSVDGHPVQLDVPAQIIQGSTMVPLRFVGEALGNNVRWDAQNNTVIISGELHVPQFHNPPPPPPPSMPGPPPPPIFYNVPIQEFPHPIVIHRDTVIPIQIGINIDFGHARQGQRVDCPIPHHPGLPPGSRAVGTVTNITTINNIQKVTINYTTIITPSGAKIPIKGHATGSVPRGGRPTAASFSVHLDQQVRIQAGPPKGPHQGH